MNSLSAPITDRFNAVFGAIGGILVYIFGEHWPLFGAFLLLNVGDWLSRWIAARLTGTENSNRAWLGILKKLGYWLMIALAFEMSVIFKELGSVIGIDFGISSLLGWFVLVSLLINEVRSILENLVDGGFNLPPALIKGLEVANHAFEEVLDLDEDD